MIAIVGGAMIKERAIKKSVITVAKNQAMKIKSLEGAIEVNFTIAILFWIHQYYLYNMYKVYMSLSSLLLQFYFI